MSPTSWCVRRRDAKAVECRSHPRTSPRIDHLGGISFYLGGANVSAQRGQTRDGRRSKSLDDDATTLERRSLRRLTDDVATSRRISVPWSAAEVRP